MLAPGQSGVRICAICFNYRASLWKSQGGKEGAQKINRTIAPHVDVMIGNEEDFTACRGFAVEGLDEHISNIDPTNFKTMIAQAVKAFPNFKVAATMLRNAKTASFNDWGAVIYAGGEFYAAPLRGNLEIYDRVGGGDGFATRPIVRTFGAVESLAWQLASSVLGTYQSTTVPSSKTAFRV